MKKRFPFLFVFLFVINTYAQVNTTEETFEVIEEYEIKNFGPFYGGGSENVYSPVNTYKGNVYFVYIDSQMRPILGKITDEEVTTSRLDKDDVDPYYVHLDGHNKFTMAIDKKGYIHIIGDMHHYGAQSTQLYVDRYKAYHKDTNPDGKNTIMYWVSEKPEDITSFKFRGGDEKRTIPGNGFTYPSFKTDMNGEIYVKHRSRVGNGGHFEGEMGWTTARYDTETEEWTALGEKTPADFMGWYDYEPLQKAIFWEDDGNNTNSTASNWYQGYTADMRFDFNNRWHLTTPINNDSSKDYLTDILYAYSDDGGATFHKADGTTISKLPIRVEEGPHQGSIVADKSDSPEGFFLVPSVATDKEGTPVITYTKLDSSNIHGYHLGSYKYWDTENNTWTEEIENPTGGFIRHIVALDMNGMVNYIEGPYIVRTFGLERTPRENTRVVDGIFQALDLKGLREQNVIRGFVHNATDETLKVVRVESKVELTSISNEWEIALLGNATNNNSGMFNDIYQLKSTGTFDENFSGEYVNQSITGNFELKARIINVNYVSDASFAGLMVRNTNNDDSLHFGVAVTSYEGVKTISKGAVNDAVKITKGYEPSEWLKIKRVGNVLESYRSDNGKEWTKLDSREIEMNETVSYGLVAGSGNNEEVTHARMDHVSLKEIEKEEEDDADTIDDADDVVSVIGGGEDDTEFTEIAFYPNPTNETINVIYPDFTGNEFVNVFDMNGRLLIRQRLERINSAIDVSKLASDMYLFKITNTNGESEIKKILIR